MPIPELGPAGENQQPVLGLCWASEGLEYLQSVTEELLLLSDFNNNNNSFESKY